MIVRSRDQSLIDECLDGRLEAFADLIRPYQDRLFNALFRMLGRHDEAAEVLQDALLRAYRSLKSYKGESAFYTWLYRIAINLAFSARRKDRQRALTTSADTRYSHQLVDPDLGNQPSRAAELQEQSELIQNALKKVSEPHRVVLVMKEIDGLRYDEIADVLDVPIGTVRSRLHRARAELRDLLHPLLAEGAI